MADLIEKAKREKEFLESMIVQIEEDLKDAPDGTLIINKNRGRIEYLQRLPDAGEIKERKIYISRENMGIAKMLAQKEYNIRLLKLLKLRTAAIERLTSKYPEQTIFDVYEMLDPEKQKLVTPIVLSDEQYAEEWMRVSYAGKAFKPDDTSSFYTEKGERVRSKSEVIIANALFHAGIPYRYECPLKLGGKTLYPDFRILKLSTRTEIIFEHFGMLDDPEYLDVFLKKLDFYAFNGLLPGRGLIYTQESSSHPLDTRVLQVIIDTYLR